MFRLLISTWGICQIMNLDLHDNRCIQLYTSTYWTKTIGLKKKRFSSRYCRSFCVHYLRTDVQFTPVYFSPNYLNIFGTVGPRKLHLKLGHDPITPVASAFAKSVSGRYAELMLCTAVQACHLRCKPLRNSHSLLTMCTTTCSLSSRDEALHRV